MVSGRSFSFVADVLREVMSGIHSGEVEPFTVSYGSEDSRNISVDVVSPEYLQITEYDGFVWRFNPGEPINGFISSADFAVSRADGTINSRGDFNRYSPATGISEVCVLFTTAYRDNTPYDIDSEVLVRKDYPIDDSIFAISCVVDTWLSML